MTALCQRGHEMTAPNVSANADGYRRCLTCKRAKDREYQRRLREQPGYPLLKKLLRRKYRRAAP